jgi:hypothetical protein
MTMPPVSSNADSDPVDRRRKFHRSLFDWCLDRADLSLQATTARRQSGCMLQRVLPTLSVAGS